MKPNRNWQAHPTVQWISEVPTQVLSLIVVESLKSTVSSNRYASIQRQQQGHLAPELIYRRFAKTASAANFE